MKFNPKKFFLILNSHIIKYNRSRNLSIILITISLFFCNCSTNINLSNKLFIDENHKYVEEYLDTSTKYIKRTSFPLIIQDTDGKYWHLRNPNDYSNHPIDVWYSYSEIRISLSIASILKTQKNQVFCDSIECSFYSYDYYNKPDSQKTNPIFDYVTYDSVCLYNDYSEFMIDIFTQEEKPDHFWHGFLHPFRNVYFRFLDSKPLYVRLINNIKYDTLAKEMLYDKVQAEELYYYKYHNGQNYHFEKQNNDGSVTPLDLKLNLITNLKPFLEFLKEKNMYYLIENDLHKEHRLK